MTLVTRALTNFGNPLVSPDGTILSGVLVTFTLVTPMGKQTDGWDGISKQRVIGLSSAVTDENGEFTVNLWPTDRANMAMQYCCHVDAVGVADFYASLPSGNTAFQWVDLQASTVPLTPVQLNILDTYRADFDLSALAAAQSAADALAIFGNASAVQAAIAASNDSMVQTGKDRTAVAQSLLDSQNLVAGADFQIVKNAAPQIITVAINSAAILAIASGMADIVAVKNNAANISTVAGIQANVTTVASIAPAVSTVAGSAAQVTTVANSVANIGVVAGAKANVDTVAARMVDIVAVAAAKDNVALIASNLPMLQDVVTVKPNLNAVASRLGDIALVVSNLPAIQNASANAQLAANSAGSAAISAGSFTANLAQLATALMKTQTIVAQTNAFV